MEQTENLMNFFNEEEVYFAKREKYTESEFATDIKILLNDYFDFNISSKNNLLLLEFLPTKDTFLLEINKLL